MDGLYADLKESAFGEYTQKDRDLIMDKVKMIYGENVGGDLQRGYMDWTMRSAAASNGYLMTKLGYKSKVFTQSEINLIYTCVAVKNKCRFCMNAHSKFGEEHLNWQASDIKVAHGSYLFYEVYII